MFEATTPTDRIAAAFPGLEVLVQGDTTLILSEQSGGVVLGYASARIEESEAGFRVVSARGVEAGPWVSDIDQAIAAAHSELAMCEEQMNPPVYDYDDEPEAVASPRMSGPIIARGVRQRLSASNAMHIAERELAAAKDIDAVKATLEMLYANTDVIEPDMYFNPTNSAEVLGRVEAAFRAAGCRIFPGRGDAGPLLTNDMDRMMCLACANTMDAISCRIWHLDLGIRPIKA